MSFKKYADKSETINGALKKTTKMSTKSNICNEMKIQKDAETINKDQII